MNSNSSSSHQIHSEQRRQAVAARYGRGRRNLRSQRGASLLEVMVVMIILLIGVFAVIRIFPVGFATLQANESRSAAVRLGREQMEQLKADQDNLPRGILYARFDSSGQRFDTTVDPDDLSPFLDPQTNKVNPYFSDVNKFRFIDGEPVKVPLPTAVGASTFTAGSLYTVKFGPMYMNQAVGDPDNAPQNFSERAAYANYLRVYGAPLRGIYVDADNTGPGLANRFLRGPQTYLLDPGEDGQTARIMLQPSTRDRYYLISYSYEINNGIQSENKVPIQVPGDPNPTNFQWINIPTKAGGNVSEVLPESVVVVREFDRLPASGNWDVDDPYQYKLISDNISVPSASGASPDTYANMGVLAFNPGGATYSERTAFGQRAFVAYIDYGVLDWHILREVREVPSVNAVGGAIPIRVTIPGIKKIGTPEADNTLYQGLYRDPNAKVDVQVFDLQGRVQRTSANPGLGDPLIAGDYDNRTTTDADADYWINNDDRSGTYATGTIYINPNKIPVGSQILVLYKAEGDWAVSVQKAYQTYQQLYNDAGVAQRYPDSFDNFGKDGSGANATLIFPYSDLNKSVLVTLQYERAPGDIRRLAPVQMTLEDVVEDPNTNTKYAAVKVRSYVPTLLRGEFDNAGFNWRVATDPTGVSLKTRVIWRDNDSPSNGWRVHDVDTYITRGSGS